MTDSRTFDGTSEDDLLSLAALASSASDMDAIVGGAVCFGVIRAKPGAEEFHGASGGEARARSRVSVVIRS